MRGEAEIKRYTFGRKVVLPKIIIGSVQKNVGETQKLNELKRRGKGQDEKWVSPINQVAEGKKKLAWIKSSE